MSILCWCLDDVGRLPCAIIGQHRKSFAHGEGKTRGQCVQQGNLRNSHCKACGQHDIGCSDCHSTGKTNPDALVGCLHSADGVNCDLQTLRSKLAWKEAVESGNEDDKATAVAELEAMVSDAQGLTPCE